MKKYWTLVLALFAIGCSNDDVATGPPDGTTFSKNFIQTYVKPTRVELNALKNSCIIYMKFNGGNIYNHRSSTQSEYDSFAQENNDLSFNRRIVAFSTVAVGPKISGIDVVCDKAIDEDHPAGSSLNDIVKICAVSFKEFIDSNYDLSFGKISAFPSEFNSLSLYNGIGSFPVYSSLDELKKEDISLIDPAVCLLLTEKPQAGVYEFTVTVDFDGANPLTGKTILSFD